MHCRDSPCAGYLFIYCLLYYYGREGPVSADIVAKRG